MSSHKTSDTSKEPLRPGPLLWVRGLARENPEEVERKILNLLCEGPAVLEELESLCFEAFKSLLDRNDATEDDEAITVLAAQFLDATAAARILLQRGQVRAALSQIRAMIESRLVMEYLRGDEDRAEQWRKARTSRERKKFAFEVIYQKSDKADLWKKFWDMCNEIVHTNRGALPAQSRLRPVLGIDTYIGSFYEPSSIATFFLIVLAFVQWFGGLIEAWYRQHPLFPSNFHSRFDAICSGYHAYAEALEKRSYEEQKLINQDTGTVSLKEQIEAARQLMLTNDKGTP